LRHARRATTIEGAVNVRKVLPALILVGLVGVYFGYRRWQASLPYEWSGTVEIRDVSVGSRAGGRVKEVLAREGDDVAAGQPLVVLEPGDLEAQKLIAQANLAQAQATLDKLEKGARPEEIEQARARAMTAQAALRQSRAGARGEQIAAAEARLAAAQASADKAALDADRAKKLFATGAISKAEIDAVDTNVRASASQRDALAKQLEELKNGARREELDQAAARAMEANASAKLVQAGARVEDLRAAAALVDAAKGRLDQVNVLLDELVIKAPRAARVQSLDLRPGDLLTPSQTAATLLEKGQMYVRIYVPETQLGRIKVGDEVSIFVDSFPGRGFKGVVEHVSGVGEYSPRNLQTADERADQVFASRVGLREGEGELRAGMAAFMKVAR
jgi:multidrug resistance efflux pump